MKKYRLFINGTFLDEFTNYKDAYLEGIRLGLPFKVKKMNLIKRIKAKTSFKNRAQGVSATAIASICAGILTTGLVTNPVGITILTIGALVSGVIAREKALKVGEDKIDLK